MKTNENTTINSQMKGANKPNGNSIDLGNLVSRVKAEDEKNLRLTKTFQWVYVVMIILYTGMLFFPYSGMPITKKISWAFYIASMIAFALIFRFATKEYKSIDYSLPVIDMLRGAANRYRLRVDKLMLIAIPIVLMDAGVTLSFYSDLLPMAPINRVLIVQAVYIPVMSISAFIGVMIWRTKQKPLRDNALKLIEELEGE
jgi:hypothetical membrane protein